MERNERRVLRATLRAETYASNGAKVLRGTAAAYGVPTLLGDRAGNFHEVIAPGAFTRALKRGDDVRALVNHDPNLILGRTKSGTLRLSESSRGLDFSVTLPDTVAGRDAWISVQRGDWDSCSFAFSVDGADGESWQDDWDCPGDSVDCCGRTTPLRTIKNVRLYDVAVAVTYPAYKQGTSVKGLVEDLSGYSDDEDEEDNDGDGSGAWYQNSAVFVSAETRARAMRSQRKHAAKEAHDFASQLFKAQVRATRTLVGGGQ